jgi:hypothetical protein
VWLALKCQNDTLLYNLAHTLAPAARSRLQQDSLAFTILLQAAQLCNI